MTILRRGSIIRFIGGWRAETLRFVGFRGPGRPVFGFPSHRLVGAGSGSGASGGLAVLAVSQAGWPALRFIPSGQVAEDPLLVAFSSEGGSRPREAADARNPVGVQTLLFRPLGLPGGIRTNPQVFFSCPAGGWSRSGWEAMPPLRRCTEGEESSCRNADDRGDVPEGTAARVAPVAPVVLRDRASRAAMAAGVAVAFVGAGAVVLRRPAPVRSAWTARGCGRRSRSRR